MGKTYKHIQKNKEKQAHRNYKENAKHLKGSYRHESEYWIEYLTVLKNNPKWEHFYSKNPGWWDHLNTERPNRHKAKRLAKQVHKMYPEFIDGILWPMAHKPKVWYW